MRTKFLDWVLILGKTDQFGRSGAIVWTIGRLFVDDQTVLYY